jgi:hypothetical protein
MTQLWPEGVPIEVEADGEQPTAFRWQGQHRRVHAVVDQWIIHDEWWRGAASDRQGEVWRHYFQMQTVDGLLCVIYYDRLHETWHLERAYD